MSENLTIQARLERFTHPGYSWCYLCGRPWACVEAHLTHYSESRGCFPLCEGCWEKLETPEARLPFYAQMWQSWIDEHSMDPEVWLQIQAAVLAGL